jgi:hypothetical protein
MKTFDSYLDSIKTAIGVQSIPSSEFEYKENKWFHENRSITVIHNEADIRRIPEGDERPLLGAFHASPSEKEGECWLFPEAISDLGKLYSDEESLFIENGIVIGDLRKTMGDAITAKSTGLFPEEATRRIEMICKIQLTVLRTMYGGFGKWISQFYSNDNKDFIDILVRQFTKEVIKEDVELQHCFEWMKKKYNKLHPNQNESPSFLDPISCLKNLCTTTEDEFKTILTLEKGPKTEFVNFMNSFILSAKKTNESWKDFFNLFKELAQESIINFINTIGDTSLKKYLTEDNKENYGPKIRAIESGLIDR